MSIGERPWLLFLLLPLLLILSLSDISAATPPQVIILNSYHCGYAWSDNELTGILTRLRQDYPEIAPFIEYLEAAAPQFQDRSTFEKVLGQLQSLPGESMVINRPESFYEQYKYLTIAVSWVFAFLLLAVGILAVTILRRRRAERRLRDSEARYRNLVETSFDWIWEVDAQGRYTYASPRVVDFLGYTPEEMLGRTPFEFMPEAEARRIGEIFGAIAAARRPFTSLENVNLHLDGRRVVLETSGAPMFGPDGEFKGYRGSDRDITARQAAEQALRESEERLRLANEAANIGTLDVDLETGWIRFSPELCAILGVPPGTELNGPQGIKIVHPEDRDRVMAAHWRSKDPAGDGRIYSEHRIIRPDGEVRWLVWSGRTIFRDTAAARVPCRGIAVAFDITERKLAEEEIKINEARLASLLRISQYSPTSSQELLDYALEEAIALTGSKIGFIYFYDETTQQFTLNTWSKEVMQECTVAERQTNYQLEETGIWGEAVRQARPIMVNDFQAPHPLKKGYPEGHAPLCKYLSIPVISDSRMVAVVGVANKATDYDGADVRQLTLMMDVVWKIAERQRAEEDLRKSEERYRLLVSQIPAMVFQGYGDWSIDPFDEKVEALTGYSKEDFESRRVKWCDLIPAEDLDYATRVFIEALKTDKSYVREHRLRRKDSEIRWVQCRGQIFCNDQGKVDYISGVSFDVTERRRAQEALKERERFLADIFDSIQDGISILDTDFNILRVNQAMELWFPHALPLAGQKCYAAYRLRSAPCEVCPSRETLETGKAGHAVMTKIGPDGEADGWLEVYTFPMLEIGSGKVRGIIQYLRDITKPKQAEEALQLSEEKYRLLVKQIPAIVFKGYADWSVDFFDNKIEALTGYSKEEFDSRQMKWCKLILPEDLEQAKGRFIKGIKTGGAYGREYRIRKKDGGVAWIQVMGQIFYDAEGKLDYISGVFFDITARKRAEEDLRQSEARLAEAQRIAQVGSWEWNVKTNQAIWSDELFRIFHLPPQEYGLSYEGLLQYVHPDDRESLEQGVTKALASGKPFAADCRIILDDGSQLYIHLYAEIILDESGEPELMRGTAQDITARVLAEQKLRESNERFAAVFENAAIGIAVADAQGRILATNPSFQEMLGYHTNELLAKTFPEITHPEDLAQNLELFQEMMTGKREGFQLEKRYLRKNGEYFWARVTVSSIKDTKGQPLYSIAMVEDITLRKQAQEKMEESERNLRYLTAQLLTAQERERQRISRDLHDDLGQSLVALKLQLQAIEREEPANLTELRQKVATQTAFIDDIVNNIRRLCMDLRPTTLDVLGLIVALKRLFKEFSALYGIKFSLDLDDVRDLLSPQAQIIIYRIFQESLTNIAKYAQATRATVTIKRENDTVFFTVQDNGKGFDLEQVRTRSVRKRGLGLTAMEERVRMLGGTLEMQSQKGVGTRISFKIPVSLLRHSKVGN